MAERHLRVLSPTPTRFHTVHGYRRAYRVQGSGPALLLVHGIGDSSRTWDPVVPRLARHFTVITPDLLGHGQSDRPRADYSVAGYANGMRDLLGVLDVERVTVAGHSLGGGVAMQFAYQYPERTERLVLVNSGGVGREVNPVLRAISLPLVEHLLAGLSLPTVRWQVEAAAAVVRRLPVDLAADVDDLLRMFQSLPDAAARSVFRRTLHSVVDWRGQVVTMLDRCYLAAGMPTLLVWGRRDPVIPVAHAYRAREAMPGSRLEIFEDAGHFPFHADPARFARVLRDFMRTTAPADWAPGQWRDLLRNGRPVPSAAQQRQSVRSAT
ncbi:MAG TPA: alpha/beta hydrolase [Dermatophilaceae bacterium]|nr:alpha/beta hydrolase [Dermatophilaceae bacterium]